MNYVYERDYAVLVRLKVPPRREGHGADPRRGALARLHRQALRPRAGRIRARPASRHRNAGARPVRRMAALASAAARHARGVPVVRRHLPGRDPACRAPSPSRDPYVFPIDDGIVDYAAPQKFFRDGDRARRASEEQTRRPEGAARRACARRWARARVPAVRRPIGSSGTPLGEAAPGAMFWAVLGALAGGILLNLMPCVFPILALKALHLSRAGELAGEARRDALAYAAGAVVGTGALGAALARHSRRREWRPAGRSSCRTRARSCCCCCSRSRSPPTCSACSSCRCWAAGRGRRAASAPARSPRSSRLRAPDRSWAWRLGPRCCSRSPDQCWCSPRSVSGLAIPFLLIAFIPALRNKAAEARPVDETPPALPRHSDGRERRSAALWLLYRQSGDRGAVRGLAGGALIAALLFAYGYVQRRSARADGRSRPFVALTVFAIIRRCRPIVERPSAIAGAERVERSAHRELRRAGPPRVRLFHRRLVPDLQGQRGRARSTAPRSATRSGKPASRCLPATGPTAIPAITRFLESRGRAGVPLLSVVRAGQARPRNCRRS